VLHHQRGERLVLFPSFGRDGVLFREGAKLPFQIRS
jgi:hypothetical protein